MNIYIDARALQKPDWQGEQVYVHSLLTAMAHAAPEHHFHLHFAAEDWSAPLDALAALPNITPHRCPGRLWSHASIPLKILQTRSSVYFRMYNEYRALLVPMPCPVVALIHDLRHLQPNVSGPSTPRKDNPDDHPHVRNFDHIVAVSGTVKHEISTLFHINADRITVAHNAIDIPAALGAQHGPPGIDATTRFFLMVNPGAPHKNWSDALAGFADYRACYNDHSIRLVLAGNLHDEAPAIRARIAANPLLADSVLCLGYVGDAQLRYLYSHARALLYPSRYEGFGRPILEAMVYGTPVIAADIPVSREVAAGAALAVPLDAPSALADALYRVETDHALRETLAARGKARARQFSWDQSAAAALHALVTIGNAVAL
jgi:glycosyltransferase involved in cell wall biosynthesis